jgi:hypothetical protein
MNPTLSALADLGYKVAVHGYLWPDGKIRVSYVAKHPESGAYFQGWNRGGTADDALRDLARNAAKVEDAIPVVSA